MTTAWMQEVEAAPTHPTLATFAHPCAAQRRSKCRGAFDFGFGVHDARYTGPLDRGEPAEELSEGWPTRCGPVRRQSMDGLSANPAAGSRTWSTGTVRKARVWGCPSLGLRSLGQAREGRTLAMDGEWNKTGCLHTECGRTQTKQSHWTPAFAGVTNRHSCARCAWTNFMKQKTRQGGLFACQFEQQRRRWITRRSCGLPFGPFAPRMFASASCLRSPAFAGMTNRQSRALSRAGRYVT